MTSEILKNFAYDTFLLWIFLSVELSFLVEIMKKVDPPGDIWSQALGKMERDIAQIDGWRIFTFREAIFYLNLLNNFRIKHINHPNAY